MRTHCRENDNRLGEARLSRCFGCPRSCLLRFAFLAEQCGESGVLRSASSQQENLLLAPVLASCRNGQQGSQKVVISVYPYR